jgi:hypothetical protein
MSYTNNWVKNLSESYINNNRPTNLQEQLDEQVELNEQLMNLIEALCEELGIDAEELLEMSMTPGRWAQAGEREKEARHALRRTRPGSQRNRKLKAAHDKLVATHTAELHSRERFDVAPEGSVEGTSQGRQPRQDGDRFMKSGSPYDYIHGSPQNRRHDEVAAMIRRSK